MTCGPRKVGSAKGANRYEKQQLGLRATGEGRCPFDHLNYYHNLLAGLMQVSAGCVVCVIDRLGIQREPTNLCEADQPEALRRIRRARNPSLVVVAGFAVLLRKCRRGLRLPSRSSTLRACFVSPPRIRDRVVCGNGSARVLGANRTAPDVICRNHRVFFQIAQV